METLETFKNAPKKHATVQNSNCCSDCTNKTDSTKLHCTKSHTHEELTKTERDINNLEQHGWQLDSLADYIYSEHHQYYCKEEPVLSEMLVNMVDHPETRYPEIQRLSVLFSNLKNELSAHLLLEECTLFPHIKNMVKAMRDRLPVAYSGIKCVALPVNVMQGEHERIEQILIEISMVTNGYTLTENASENFIRLYKKLKALHKNLHRHIYFENHILYPKAILLEAELKKLGFI